MVVRHRGFHICQIVGSQMAVRLSALLASLHLAKGGFLVLILSEVESTPGP
jgi:hypothetical protein